MKIQYFLNKLVNKENLSIEEVKVLLSFLTNEEILPSQIGAVLIALRAKGETTEEIEGFILAMRDKMQKIEAKDAIDVCGSGGDNSGTFNISTAVAFVVAGCGVKVAKHGNRASSSKCGSADVLESLGVNITLTLKEAEEVFKRVGMVFLFASLFNKSFKKVSLVRKELGIKTIFNFLGPFVNPASVKKQLVGISDIQMAEKLAKVALKLNYKHLIIVVGEGGFDEVSISDKTTVFNIEEDKLRRYIFDPNGVFKNIGKGKLTGGFPEVNSEIIKGILRGTRSTKRSVVVLNSAFALQVAGKVKTIEDGIKLAEQSIDSGKALHILELLKRETQKYA